jgi:hypothetical protein
MSGNPSSAGGSQERCETAAATLPGLRGAGADSYMPQHLSVRIVLHRMLVAT